MFKCTGLCVDFYDYFVWVGVEFCSLVVGLIGLTLDTLGCCYVLGFGWGLDWLVSDADWCDAEVSLDRVVLRWVFLAKLCGLMGWLILAIAVFTQVVYVDYGYCFRGYVDLGGFLFLDEGT